MIFSIVLGSLAIATAILLYVLFAMSKIVRNGYFSLSLKRIHAAYRGFPLFPAFGRVTADRKAPKGLPSLPVYEKVSKRCHRILGLNPGSHTLQGTNTWLVGTGRKKILVDTGEDITSDDYVSLLVDTVFPATNTTELQAILLTHGHGDHQGGVLPLLHSLKLKKWPKPELYKRNVKDGGDFPCIGFEAKHIEDGQIFTIPGDEEGVQSSATTLTAVYTPGHTDDHVAFLLSEDRALFSGDCVLGCGTTVFDTLYEYMNSLNRLRDIVVSGVDSQTGRPLLTAAPGSSESDQGTLCAPCNSEARVETVISQIYPGAVVRGRNGIVVELSFVTMALSHGPVITDPLGKIDEYIHHRNLREEQILRVLHHAYVTDEKHPSYTGPWLSPWDLVLAVYPASLPFRVKVSAHWNVCHHLDKLLKDGKIDTKFPDLWSLKPLS